MCIAAWLKVSALVVAAYALHAASAVTSTLGTGTVASSARCAVVGGIVVLEMTLHTVPAPLRFWLALVNQAPINHTEVQQLGASAVIGSRWYDKQFPPCFF